MKIRERKWKRKNRIAKRWTKTRRKRHEKRKKKIKNKEDTNNEQRTTKSYWDTTRCIIFFFFYDGFSFSFFLFFLEEEILRHSFYNTRTSGWIAHFPHTELFFSFFTVKKEKNTLQMLLYRTISQKRKKIKWLRVWYVKTSCTVPHNIVCQVTAQARDREKGEQGSLYCTCTCTCANGIPIQWKSIMLHCLPLAYGIWDIGEGWGFEEVWITMIILTIMMLFILYCVIFHF